MRTRKQEWATTRIAGDRDSDRRAWTNALDAIREGVAVVVQAPIGVDGWRGRADVLRRRLANVPQALLRHWTTHPLPGGAAGWSHVPESRDRMEALLSVFEGA